MECKFITIVLAGLTLPALGKLQSHHMVSRAATPLCYTKAHFIDICFRPQWEKEQLHVVAWEEKAIGGDIVAAQAKARQYYQVARGFLQMQTAPDVQWFAASFVPLFM